MALNKSKMIKIDVSRIEVVDRDDWSGRSRHEVITSGFKSKIFKFESTLNINFTQFVIVKTVIQLQYRALFWQFWVTLVESRQNNVLPLSEVHLFDALSWASGLQITT